jgi:ABC-2 type transport system permease protein
VTLTIAWREFRNLFLSPLAWVVLAVVQFILGYSFLVQMELIVASQGELAALPDAPGITELVAQPLYGVAAIVMLMVAPMLTMRSIAEERRNGTLVLLLTAPVALVEVVLGKFLGLLGLFTAMVLLTSLMPLSLALGTELDFGLVAAGALGLFLLLATFAAVGLFMSSLTDQPTVAAVATYGALLFLWIIDWAAQAEPGGVSGLFPYLSLIRHFEDLSRGLFSSADVAYFLIAITLFLLLTLWRLDAERLPGR